MGVVTITQILLGRIENVRFITHALDAGALGAKLAGAGGGGTIIALTLDPDALSASLKEAGALRILYPQPRPGATVVPISSKADWAAAERTLVEHSHRQDFGD